MNKIQSLLKCLTGEWRRQPGKWELGSSMSSALMGRAWGTTSSSETELRREGPSQEVVPEGRPGICGVCHLTRRGKCSADLNICKGPTT